MKTQLKYSFSNLIKLFETLILNIGLARIIVNLTTFGKLQQFFIIVTFLITIFSAFPTSLNFFIGKNLTNIKINALFKRFFVSMILFVFVFSVIFSMLDNHFLEWFQNDYFIKFNSYFFLILFFKVINIFFSNYYLFTNKLNFLNGVSAGFLLLYLFGFIYCGYNKLNVDDILVFFVIYETSKFLILFTPFIKTFKSIKTREHLIIEKEEFKFVIPTVFLVLAAILNMQIDKYMISSMKSPEVFAIYQVGAFNIPFIAVITTSFFTIVTPKIARLLDQNKISETLKLTSQTIKQTTLLLLPIIVFCFFFSTEIIVLLFGNKFEVSGGIFRIYTLRFLLAVFPFSIYMGVIGLKNFASIHVISSAIINIICNLILIPKMGLMGAVVATLIASYATVLIPIGFINKKLSTNFSSYFPVAYFFKILVYSILIILPIYFVYSKDYFVTYDFFIVPIAIVYYGVTLFLIERSLLINFIKQKL